MRIPVWLGSRSILSSEQPLFIYEGIKVRDAIVVSLVVHVVTHTQDASPHVLENHYSLQDSAVTTSTQYALGVEAKRPRQRLEGAIGVYATE